MSTAPREHITPVITDFMTKLTDNFTERFPLRDCSLLSMKPEAYFCVKTKKVMSWIDESLFQMKMVDVQSAFDRSLVSFL